MPTVIGVAQLFWTYTKPRSPYVAHTLPESKVCASVTLPAVSSELPSAAHIMHSNREGPYPDCIGPCEQRGVVRST